MEISFDQIRADEKINTYIRQADASMRAMGYTEHSFAHVTRCADRASRLLEQLGYSARELELVRIAAYLHDIGNVVNRNDHAHSGAVLAFQLLDELGMDAEEVATVITAIGNHDESTAYPVNAVAAALILADKTDVRYTRVRTQDFSKFDIHDRVNYSVKESEVEIVKDSHIVLNLKIETEMCSVMDYFEIFLNRMLLCKKAAEKLGVSFWLVINGQRLV